MSRDVLAPPPATHQTDTLSPFETVRALVEIGERKAVLPVSTMVSRGIFSAGLLGIATMLAVTAWAQGLPHLVGALVFPVGFCLLVLFGFELATGNFGILPASWLAGRVTGRQMLRSWAWVYLGNLLGGVAFAVAAAVTVTAWWSTDGGAVGEQLRQVAVAKTQGYAEYGLRGWLTVFTKGILANWLVALGATIAFVSRSTSGKVVVMWLPIMSFVALSYEHSIVNLFVIPAGILVGAPVTLADWWLWNQVPSTLGNVVGGAVLTGLALVWTQGLHVER